jgi:hypothetical protein
MKSDAGAAASSIEANPGPDLDRKRIPHLAFDGIGPQDLLTGQVQATKLRVVNRIFI